MPSADSCCEDINSGQIIRNFRIFLCATNYLPVQ